MISMHNLTYFTYRFYNVHNVSYFTYCYCRIIRFKGN